MTPDAPHILALDIGTTSVKAVLFDLAGNVVSSGLQEYELETPEPGIVELWPEVYWESAKAAVAQVLSAAPSGGAAIAAAGVTSQGETLIVLDESGQPLRKAIVWLDNRSTSEAGELAGQFSGDEVYRVTGQQEMVPTWPATKILWLRRNEPDVFSRACHFLLVEDYILYRLTGEYVADAGLYPSSLCLDIRDGTWWDSMLEALELPRAKLPRLLQSGEVAGSVTSGASRETGIPEGVPVCGAPMDQIVAAAGAGNIRPGMITETTGSALAVCATLDGIEYLPEKQAGLYLHAAPGKYAVLPWIPVGGMILRWFRDQFMARDGYAEMDAQAAGVAIGSDGLLLLPHLAGAVSPAANEHARGVFYGFTLAHGRAHFIRAILESIAFILRDNLELLESVGIADDTVTSLGGGAASRLWLQIKADVLGKAVRTMKCDESTCLGTAMLAGVGAGLFGSLDGAAAAMVGAAGVLEPSPKAHVNYNDVYQQYKKINSILLPTFGG